MKVLILGLVIAATTALLFAQEPSLPTSVGIYLKRNDKLIGIDPELATIKMGSPLKSAFSYGIAKMKVNGELKGASSTTRLGHPVEILLYTFEGASPKEYELVKLDTNKKSRQFRIFAGSITGSQSGDPNAIPFQAEKIADRTYKVVLDLKPGEYGFVAPGSTGSPASGQISRVYTFGVE